MIDERELTLLVAQAASAHPVPEDGPSAILAAAGRGVPGPTSRAARRTGRRPLLVAAAVTALVVTGALAAGTRSRNGNPEVTSQPLRKSVPMTAVPASSQDPFQVQPQAQSQSQLQSQSQPQASSSPAASSSPGPSQVNLTSGGRPAPPGARVVRTATVKLEVAQGRFATVVDHLSTLATGRGGLVAAAETSERDSAPSGTVTLRVPADGFDTAISEVRRLGKVLAASSRAEDVTAASTDLDARVRALEAARSQVLTVLAKADSVGDILAVQQRLDIVQTQIEQLQAQQRLLEEQTSLGALTVHLAEPGARVGAATHRSGLAGAWDDARHGFGSGIETILAGSGTALVVVLCLAVLAGALRVAWILLRRRLV